MLCVVRLAVIRLAVSKIAVSKLAGCQNHCGPCVLQMADMHLGRGSLCTANLHSSLWAVGGRDSHTFHHSTECFHPALNVWTMGPSTITKRFAAAGGALGGAIYITGGFDASTYTASAERLDPREGRWCQVGFVPANCCTVSASLTMQSIYVISHYQHCFLCTLKWPQ